MSNSLMAPAAGVLVLPAATVLFARTFWIDRWANRVRSTSLAAVWGIIQLLWFFGALIILPIWYLRSTYEAATPGWVLLLPFLASVAALFLFSRGNFKELALILVSREQVGASKAQKKPVDLLIEAVLVFGGSACGITLMLWRCGKIETWNDVARFWPLYFVIAACGLLYTVSYALKNKKGR